jgi:hypothetical protein
MKRRLRRDLRLGPGVYLYGDEWTQEEIVREAADDVAFQTDCLYGVRTTGLVTDQQTYCLPEIYRHKTLYVKDAGGQWGPLDSFESAEMDSLTAVSWRNHGTGDPPRGAVWQGVNAVRLHPTPSATRASALAFEGFLKPGAFWSFDEDGEPEETTDETECPLPSWAQEAVYRVARVKAAAMDERPEIAAKLGVWAAERDEELGNVEMNAARHHATVVRHAVWPGVGSWYCL